MRDRAIEPAALEHVVDFINGYADPPRREAGEQDEAYPVLGPTLSRLAGRTSKSDLAAVANRLYPIFSASDKAATATLNSLLEEAHLAPRLAWDDEEGATTAWVAPPQASRLLASCVISLWEWFATNETPRVGTCAADRCVDVFVDNSPAGVKRFCSTTCLNRTKVAAHRARQRAKLEELHRMGIRI
jgi:predicted RNA-binding Zn ribbon-like protein